MGYVSVEQGDHLFWLGRYVERVCLTLHYLEELYDVLFRGDPLRKGYSPIPHGSVVL